MGRIESKIEMPSLPQTTLTGSGTSGQVTYWSGSNILGGFTLNSAQLIVGDGSNLPAAVTVSGDVTISNAGVTAIGAGKVTDAMLTGSTKDSRNWVHNGAMQIHQLAASVATGTGDNHTIDRWFVRTSDSSGGAYTLSRAASSPTLAQSSFYTPYSLKVDCTGTATPGTVKYAYIQQTIEGFDYGHLAGKQVTISFWVNAVKNGIYCLAVQTAAGVNSYVSEYTISAANTWEKKTITLTLNPATEDSNFTNDRGLLLIWTIVAGSSFQTTANAWQVGTFYSTSNQVNGADNTANNFFLTQVCLNIGSSAAPFSLAGKSFAQEVLNCQRFFEKSADLESAPNVASTQGCAYANTLTTTKTRAQVNYRAMKNQAPTVTVYSTSTGTAAKFRDVTAAADIAASTNSGGNGGFTYESTAAVTVGNDVKFHWQADARFGS